MTRVLLVHPSTELYGSDRMLVASALALDDRGFTVTVVLPGGGELADMLRDADVNVRTCAGPVLRKDLLRPLGLLRFFVSVLLAVPRQAALIRSCRAQLVYVNTLTLPTWALAARLVRRPVVCHVHESEEDAATVLRVGLLAQLLLAKEIICNSEASAQFVRQWPGARRQAAASVVYNGMELSRGCPRSLSEDAAVRLVLVGRLSPRKGQDVALRALALVREAGRDVELRLVGDVFVGYEWYDRELEELAASLQITFHVTRTGFLGDVQPEYERADLVLVPSRAEPFGNVAVEALATARPVIASRVQGLPEILQAGGGLLVPPDDPQALAAAVLELLALQDAEWLAMAEAGRDQVLRRFGLERYGDEIATVLRRGLA